jgi:cell division protein FtsQ
VDDAGILRSNKHCKGVNINIIGVQNNFFIDKKEIADVLEKLCNGSVVGKTLGAFNLSSIETTLKKNEWIKNAELFFDNNEMLRVEVVEREPVARIFTNSGSSFYLDSALMRLPLSDKSTARVPVFSNFTSAQTLTKADSNLLNDIKNISIYILRDPFWMAQIDQVDITSEKTFEMVPKVGNQIIVFGNANNYEEKFNNLLTFYKQVASKVGWNKYSKINVQYRGQVVAVKRGAEDIVQDLLRTKQMMQTIVIASQQQANDSINNIQLDQQQDDNIIPVAPQLNDIPHEQPITVKPPTTITEPVKTVPPSIEKPIANPAKTIQPSIEKPNANPAKITVPEKKIMHAADKPFWLKSVLNKPTKSLKNTSNKSTSTKSRSTSIERSNPNPPKKIFVVKSSTTKPINKSIIKTTNKPIIKTKPKAVLPPKNDY